MTDLVSRLLEAITAKEEKAQAAPPWPWRTNAEHDEVVASDGLTVCDGFALSNNQLRAAVDHVVDNDPSSVLHRCATDKVIAETTRMAQEHYREVLAETEGDPGSSARVADAWRQATTWEKAARLVAEGYGLSGHREGDNG